jgi:hypothetical protein
MWDARNSCKNFGKDIFFSYLLFKAAFKGLDCLLSNDEIISEQWIGKNKEEISSVLISGAISPFPEILRKTTKTHRQYSRCVGRYINFGPSENIAELLPLTQEVP